MSVSRLGLLCPTLAIALALTGCAVLGPSTRLPEPVVAALERQGLPAASLGIAAWPLSDGKNARGQGLRIAADAPLQPASTMKLVTAVVALDRLGANARGRTELLADAMPADGALRGPLYLRGGADTELDWGALYALLREARELHGLRRIEGGLVVDRALFTPAREDLGAAPFDAQPEFPYNQIPDALQLNANLLRIALRADGRRVDARMFPAWPGIAIDASGLALSDARCADWEDGWQTPQVDGLTIRLRGAFPRDCAQTPALNLVDRQALAAAAVRAIWRELGGELLGPDREDSAPADARVLAVHRGRPLAEVLREALKSSDNPLARLTFLRLGAAGRQIDERTRDAAARAVHDWFAAQGIATDGLVLDNGAGLSRSERIAPAQLAAVLDAAWRGRHAPELLAALPVAGVDGTMSRRLKGTPAEGRARLKTGTLRNVVALAGYVPDASGRTWVVAALLNDEQASKGRPVLDALIDWIARQ